MNTQVSLSQGQINFALKLFTKVRDKRQAQIDKATRKSSTADLEILAIDDLIASFNQATAKTVEVPQSAPLV
jgi:ATP adenylyltransferase/5',5'''-P-1,P-4-tetraphosphate phosphorylase II